MEGFKYQRPSEANPELPVTSIIDLTIDGKEVGHAMLEYNSHPVPHYYLGQLWIEEEERSKGYGNKLMEQIEQLLKSKGKAGVLQETIETYDPNSPAIGMYARRGWKQVPGKNFFVYNLPQNVTPERFLDYTARRHNPVRQARTDRRYLSISEDA